MQYILKTLMLTNKNPPRKQMVVCMCNLGERIANIIVHRCLRRTRTTTFRSLSHFFLTKFITG